MAPHPYFARQPDARLEAPPASTHDQAFIVTLFLQGHAHTLIEAIIPNNLRHP